MARAVKDEAARHAVDREPFRENALRIEDHPELRGMLVKESLGVGLPPVNIDSDDCKSSGTELLLKVIHEWEGFQAWHTPRGPEV